MACSRSPGRRSRLLGVALAVALAAGLAAVPGPPCALADFGEEEKQFRNDAYPAELRREVTAAVDRAAHWLLQRQSPDGSWNSRHNASYGLGPTALATLALLKAGVPADHPRVERAFRFLRTQPLDKTYSVAILLMALDAKYEAAEDGFAQETIDRYGNRIESKPCEEKIAKDDLEWMKAGVDFLLKYQGVGSGVPAGGGNGNGARGETGAWRYPGGGWDLSNTQYALLGLKAAVRCGIKIPAEAWLDSLKFLLDIQEKTGDPVEWRANEVRGDYRIEWTERAKARGFSYAAEGRSPTGSMTTAGLAGLMICQSELWKSRRFTGDLREKTRTAIRDGLAWMQVHYDVTTNPEGGPNWHYYYLYGLERAGILGRTRFLGTRDWYLDGARYLLALQDPGGSWKGGDLEDTCFALLFLKRASWRTANPAITPGDHPLPPGR